LLTKVTWQMAGRVTEPGRYMFRFGWLTADAEEYHLGAFELPAVPPRER